MDLLSDEEFERQDSDSKNVKWLLWRQ